MNVQLTATYVLVNRLNGIPQTYNAGKNIKGLTNAEIVATISASLKTGSKIMEMKDNTVIVADRKGRIHRTINYLIQH